VVLDGTTGDLTVDGEATRDRPGGFRYILAAVPSAGIAAVNGKPKSEWGYNPLERFVSGRILNRDLQRIQKYHSQRIKGPRIPLTAKRLQKINVTLDDRGLHVGLLRQGGALNWPEALRTSSYTKERQQVSAALPKAVALAKKGEYDDALLKGLV